MKRLTLTSAGRQPITAGQIPSESATPPLPPLSKWHLLRRLIVARHTFGLSHRTLSVLNALLTFHPREELSGAGPIVVFPSNASLSARAHGMPESTLRRHLAALLRSGLLWRHDSPNGKRYARRSDDGALVTAFGFDISPLLARAAEIHAAADEADRNAEDRRRRREECVLLLRDITSLIELQPVAQRQHFTDVAQTARRALRRTLDLSDLDAILADLTTRRDILISSISSSPTPKLGGNHSQNERHHQRSDTKNIDTTSPPHAQAKATVSLSALVAACPDVEEFVPGSTKTWPNLISGTKALARMIGIDMSSLSAAENAMGKEMTAVTVACLIQRAADIRSPEGYFRTLVRKAEHGDYTPLTMIRALERRSARCSV